VFFRENSRVDKNSRFLGRLTSHYSIISLRVGVLMEKCQLKLYTGLGFRGRNRAAARFPSSFVREYSRYLDTVVDRGFTSKLHGERESF